MVEVFKTNVQEQYEARALVAVLLTHFPESKINVDLHDCDKVLRIEGGNIAVGEVISVVNKNGFLCHMLE